MVIQREMMTLILTQNREHDGESRSHV